MAMVAQSVATGIDVTKIVMPFIHVKTAHTVMVKGGLEKMKQNY
jgi:hypothetical protein